MKKIIFFSATLLFSTVLLAQNQITKVDLAEQNKSRHEVHAINQSLAEAYVQGAAQKDVDVFYADNFALMAKNGTKQSRQGMEEKMQGLVKNGLLSHLSIRHGDVQMAIEANTAIVNGDWKVQSSSTTGYDNLTPYTFTYGKQNGVWKLISAQFLPNNKAVVATKISRTKPSGQP